MIATESWRLDPVDYERTVSILLRSPSHPVITKKPDHAWTHRITDAGQRLSADELHRLVPGATLRGEVADGETFEGTYFRDGTMAISTEGDADTGTWDYDGDTICLTWTKWRNGERYCIYWMRDGEGYVSYNVDGRLSTRFTIAE